MGIVRGNLRPIIRALDIKSSPPVMLNGIHFHGLTSLFVHLDNLIYIGEISGVKTDSLGHPILEIVTDSIGRTTIVEKAYLNLDYFLKNDADQHVKAYLSLPTCEVFDDNWWNFETRLVKVQQE